MIAAWMLFTLEISVLFFVAAWLAERALNAARRPVRGVWMTAMIATALLPLTAFFAPVPQLAIPDLQAVSRAFPDSAKMMTPKKNSAVKRSTVPDSALALMTQSIGTTRANVAPHVKPVATPAEQIIIVNDSLQRSVAPRPSLANREARLSPKRSSGLPVLPSAIASQLEVTPNSAFQRLNSSLLNAWLVIAGIGSLICLIAVARTMRQRGTWSGEYVDGMPVLVSHDVGPALIGVLQYSIVVPRWVFELEGRARKLIH
ncbi:MAG: hypothetical protein ABJB66_21330, partial [Gemmatimonadaceae bacterium]